MPQRRTTRLPFGCGRRPRYGVPFRDRIDGGCPRRNAALAGGLTGFANGFTSTLIAYLTLILPTVEDVPTPGIFAIYAAVGALLGAFLGWFTAWMASMRNGS